LREGPAPPTFDEDDPTVASIAAPMAGKGKGTYKTLNK
jgi:hypothetical protein